MDYCKKNIRKKMLDIRNAMTAGQVREKSLAIINNLFESGILNNAGLVLLFAPVRNEPDMFLAHDMIKGEYSHVPAAYPKVFINENAEKSMDFFIVEDYKSELEPGYMNIMEPNADSAAGNVKKVDLSLFLSNGKRALIIVPGLAFDIYGNRTGYGGGFYDRYLQPCGENENIIKAAVCYDFQLSKDAISSSAHDVKMDYIFTDRDALLIK